MRLYATASHGTESAVRDELRELRFRGVRAERGGVAFEGALGEAMRACFELRTAVRVLVHLADFDAPDERALYDAVRALDLSPWLRPDGTLAVRVALKGSPLTHSQFVAQRTKDAVVDRMRELHGVRPSVDKERPELGLFVRLERERGSLWAEASGEPLFVRGYRAGSGGEAPLKETLAASLLRLGGWDRERPLGDPMCGSGTFGIEAALWARDVAPGLLRDEIGFGYRRWPCVGQAERAHDRALEEAARARVRRDGPRIRLADHDPAAAARAGENARRAGVSTDLSVGVEAFERTLADAPDGAFVITNPPYGERLAATAELYADLGAALREIPDGRFAVLAGSRELAQAMRLRWDAEREVKNGQILATFVAGGTGGHPGRASYHARR